MKTAILGIDSEMSIAAGAIYSVNSISQVEFTIEKFFVDDSCANAFYIKDFRVGIISEFLNADCVPSTLFSKKHKNFISLVERFKTENRLIQLSEEDIPLIDLIGFSIGPQKCRVGTMISCIVINKSISACRFIGAVIGKKENCY